MFCFVMAGTLVLAILFLSLRNSPAYQLEVVNVGTDAYGYRILYKERTVVYQPFIPALSGKQPFDSESDARKVGNLVLQRLQSREDFVVTLTDLNNLKIKIH